MYRKNSRLEIKGGSAPFLDYLGGGGAAPMPMVLCVENRFVHAG